MKNAPLWVIIIGLWFCLVIVGSLLFKEMTLLKTENAIQSKIITELIDKDSLFAKMDSFQMELNIILLQRHIK